MAVPKAVTNAGTFNPALAGGKGLPQGGKLAPAQVAGQQQPAQQPPRQPPSTDVPALVAALNKFLNDSGRPNQFRVDPAANTQIQEINPANGAVIGQFSISQFRALAQSIGATSLLVDTHA